jgi:hypothetical protein
LHDQEFRAAILADPKSASSRFSLSDEEREALLAGDVHKLYELGASAFLLTILSRFGVINLTEETFNERMRMVDNV